MTMGTTANWAGILLLLGGCLEGISPAYAQILADPARTAQKGRFELEVFRHESEADFESDGFINDEAQFSHTVFGLCGAYGVAERLDVFLLGGAISEVEYREYGWDGDLDSPFADGGSGFIGQLGIRGVIAEQGSFSAHGHALISMTAEDCGEYYYGHSSGAGWSALYKYHDQSAHHPNVGEDELTLLESTIGMWGDYEAGNFRFLMGIEMVIHQDGELDEAGVRQSDVERTDLASVKAGIQYAPERWWIRAELLLAGVDGLTIGAGVSL
jgi:hypothetical protein